MAVLTAEQAMLKDMAADWVRERAPLSAYRRLFEAGTFPLGHDPALYAEMAEMGWTGILVPPEFGGSDFGHVGAGVVLEALGRTLAASPLLGTAVAGAAALKLAGTEEQRVRWLPGIARGTAVVALASDEGGRHRPAGTALSAVRHGAGWMLNGEKRPVIDGMAADLFLVLARTSGAAPDPEGLTLFLVEKDVPGVQRRALQQIDGRMPAVLTLDSVVLSGAEMLGPVGEGHVLAERILDHARSGLAAEMLGAASQAFETTLDHLRTRVQFDRPIGAFQALQHRAAALFGELQLTRAVVESALAALDADAPDIAERVSLAKAIAGETLSRVSNEMVQMHGGIGMTHEHDAGLYLKRARVADQLYGNVALHRERWGRINGF